MHPQNFWNGLNLGFVDRRGVLTIGGLGLTGAGVSGLSLVAQAGGSTPSVRKKDTAVILFWMAGGPSHIDTYDMKPGATAEVRGPFRPVATNVPGIDVCELLPRHARLADKFSLIRSIAHNLSVHDDGSHWVQTGYPLLNARARGQTHPAQGAVVARIRGANRPGIPPYVCIPEDYRAQNGFYQRSAYLGPRYEPFNAGGDPSLGNYRPPEFTLPAEVTLPRLDDRRGLLARLDRLAKSAERLDAFADLSIAQQQALELTAGTGARQAFDLAAEPAALRERYGRHAYGQSALLARRLVEAGATFITINLFERDVDWWDDHFTIERNLRKRLPLFDQALGTLIDDLVDRGLHERVLVVACGEFGRAPRIDSGAGRGHWPGAMSVLLSGGGIRGGQIIGSTAADGSAPRDRHLLPGDLLATIYHALGIDPRAMLPDRQNRPVPIVPEGDVIRELV